MTSPFNLPNLFQLATFIFEVPVGTVSVNERGNLVTQTQQVPVTFKLKPLSQTPKQALGSQGSAQVGERYEARLVDPMTFKVVPGTSVAGVLNGRPCTMTVDSVAQSSVSPVLSKAIGEKYQVTINYQVAMGG
jgi:hypothetical protein